jgi:phage gp37-like protein
MRYKISEIEDQIIATLKADSTLSTVQKIDTYAGQVDARMFLQPEYMQGFIKLLPFCLVSYQGRNAQALDKDGTGNLYIHTLTFRIFTGARSLRNTQEAARGCYDMLASVYDDLHGKVPKSTPQCLPGLGASRILEGTAITTAEFNCVKPLWEAGGTDEQIVVNLPGIVVYRSDYNLRVMA